MSKQTKNISPLVLELARRLEETTGLEFQAANPAATGGGYSGCPRVTLPHGQGCHRDELDQDVPVLVCTSPIIGDAGRDTLTSRLLQALAGEIWADLVRGQQEIQPEFVSHWEGLLHQAVQERWEPERFAKEAASRGLGTLPLGLPVLVRCFTWTPEISDIMQGLFPDAPVRLVLRPDIFLYVPLDPEESGIIPQRTKAETLINEIYSMLADELGVKSTVLVGEAKGQNLVQSFRTAQVLADIQQRFYAGTPGLTIWQIGLAALFKDIPRGAGEEFAERILGRLGKELIDTLGAFLAKDLNLADAARALFIHRNTLIYRLDRIEELTGYNPRRMDEAISLFTALWLKQHMYLK